MKTVNLIKFLPATVTRAVVAGSLLALSVSAEEVSSIPSLPSPLCDSLQVPAGNELAFHAFAIGVQRYSWNGTAWVFIAPAAVLYGDPGYHGRIGTHFAGPTWQSNSGSQVVGRRIAACTPDPNSIPWLLLVAASSQGPGVFDGVTFVQRLNTVGGTAPSGPGSTVGQEADVPYAAEYFFYKAVESDTPDE